MAPPDRTIARIHSTLRTLAALLRSMRPTQWVKNFVVVAALVFGDKLLEPYAVAVAIWATVIFCGWSSAVYLMNDVRDAEQDRHHPLKRTRPLAAGLLDPTVAVGGALGLAAVGLAAAMAINPAFAMVGAIYLLTMVCYTFWFKSFVIVDVLIIAVGFVLRAVGGAVAIGVAISPWLLVCTLLLALFLGFGKRRHELTLLDDAPRHRANLARYSRNALDVLALASAVVAIGAYLLYAVERRGQTGQGLMVLTVPLVAAAVLRYVFLVRYKDAGGRPESTLFTDPPLLVAVVLWAILCVLILYGG